MAFDGITISCLKDELRNTLLQGRIYKIAQPETDELLLTSDYFELSADFFLSLQESYNRLSTPERRRKL